MLSHSHKMALQAVTFLSHPHKFLTCSIFFMFTTTEKLLTNKHVLIKFDKMWKIQFCIRFYKVIFFHMPNLLSHVHFLSD